MNMGEGKNNKYQGAPFFKDFGAQPCAGRSQWAEHEDINIF